MHTISDTLAAPVAADEKRSIPSGPRREKLLRWGTLLGKFVSVQIVVQALGLAAGILLVRTLSQREYAFFTIANTMQGTMGVLADSGISIGLSAIGGRVWQDRYRFGQLLNTALHLRKFLAGSAALVITPILIWMLMKAGASALYAVGIALAVLLGLSAQLTTGVLEIVPRLHSQVGRLQKMDLCSTIMRLALLGGASLAFLNSAVAVVIGSLSLLLKRSLLSRWVIDDADMYAPPSPKDRREIVSIVKHQLPNALFYCVQGQVTVWLIGIFGNTQSIAEVGALGRLAVIFSIISSVLGNIALPAFAKCQSARLVKLRYGQIICFYVVFAIFLLLISFLLPDQFLWILGKKYANLESDLVLIMFNTVISGLMNVIWSMNAARAWIKFAWVYIPITILAQTIFSQILNLHSVYGVLLFGLFSIFPGLLLSIYMGWRGYRDEFSSSLSFS